MPLYAYLIIAALALMIAGMINRLLGRVVFSLFDLIGLGVCYALYQSAPAGSLMALEVGAAFLVGGLLVDLINKTLTPASQRDRLRGLFQKTVPIENRGWMRR